MFGDCRACAAKDGEIARLLAQLGELQDRLMGMVGERFQTQFAPGAPAGPHPESEEQLEPLSETQWANEELERAAAEESRKTGGIVRDFAS